MPEHARNDQSVLSHGAKEDSQDFYDPALFSSQQRLDEMSQILIERQHDLGLPAARLQAQIWGQKATAKFGLNCRYESGEHQDVLHFNGSGMEGQLQINANTLMFEAHLNFLATMFQEKIEAKLHEQFDEFIQGI